ncbi:hypothetical protein PTTG_02136 [Puccinia triticina 1-1 BBBD Race 1]|uniref:chitin synthase n=1 Tax=Puccinia triticina (isolate 1-1 / race 1 (BBBD)) TaxID=630390 RepID=A0A180GU81_PUCT1|nr:hypothetical protein PTTG_02136 [Puccinia triticina 1-1 BBBD Race 1]
MAEEKMMDDQTAQKKTSIGDDDDDDGDGPLDVELSNSALLLVDIQHDFVSDEGALAVGSAGEILATVYGLLDDEELGWKAVDFHPPGHISFASTHQAQPFTQLTTDLAGRSDGEPGGSSLEVQTRTIDLWPDHCVQGTKGSELDGGIQERLERLKSEGRTVKVIHKGIHPDVENYSAFLDDGADRLDEFLGSLGVRNVFVAGLAGDFCVKACCESALQAGLRVFWIRDGIRSVGGGSVQMGVECALAGAAAVQGGSFRVVRGGAGAMEPTRLSQLTTPDSQEILSILHARHRAELHDILIGHSILLHINPLRPTQDTSDHSAHAYLNNTSNALPPHLYQLAADVSYALKRTAKTQAIVYSGFSGSGKTTSMKLITNQLIRLSQLNSLGPSSQSSQALKLTDQIPHLFTLLSAFSNAKTFQNPSASRLSSLLELHFDNLFHLAGAKLLVFGLERNRLRIPLKSSHDRTFDVFYQLLAGIPADQRTQLALHPDPSHYDLLASSSCYRTPDRPDADRIGFDELQAALKSLAFKPKHIHSLFKLLSAILLLGNIQFELSQSRDFQDQSASVSNPETLELVAELLGLPSPDLARVLTNRIQYIRKETVTVLLRPEAAVQQRDDFTNALYGVLVAYVVETANHKLFPGDGFINELQAQGGSSILQFDSPGPQGRSEELADMLGSGNNLPTRRQSIKKLERSNTLLGRAKSFGASAYEEFCINYQTELIHTWFSHQHLDQQSSRAAADGIQIPKIDSQDFSSSRLEMLRGGLLGGKADSKPGGIIGGLAKTSNSQRKGKYNTMEEADNDVLDGMRSHFASHPSFISRPSHSTSQSVFGIQHWSGPVSYDATGIIQADLGLVDVEFVSLLRNSTDSFVSRLLSGPSLALDRHPLDPSVLVAAQVSSSPLRRPSPILPTHPHISLEPGSPRGAPLDSTVALIDTSVVQPTLSQLNATLSQFISHFSQCQVWHVLNLKPNDELYANDWDPVRVEHQLEAFRIPDLITCKQVDYPFDFDLTMFSIRFRLEGTEASDLRRQLTTALGLEENKDFAIGRSRVWLTLPAFQSLEERLLADHPAGSQPRPIAGHLAGVDIPGGSPRELDSWGDLGGGGSGSYQHLVTGGSGSGDDRPHSGYEAERNIPQSPGFGGETELPHGGSYQDGPAQSRVWGSEWESKQPEEQVMLNKEARYMDVGLIKHNQIDGNTNRDGATDDVLLKTDQNQTLEEVESSRGRMWWVVIVWSLTFYIPNFFLSTMGRMKRPDIQMAWREKVALCLIIFLMCGAVLFVILGLGKIMCPNLAKAWTPTELGYHATESDFYVGVRGQVFDLGKFWKGQHSDITAQPVTNSDMLSLAGQDLTNYFPVPLRLACPNVQVDTVNIQFENWTATVPNAVHVSGSAQVVKSSALGNDKWYTEKFLPFMTNFYKGPIVYGHKLISGLANNRSIGIYDGGVYDLSDYFYTYNTQNRNPQFQYIDKSISDLFQQQPGQDITKEVNALPLGDAEKSASLACLRNMFYLGDTDFREGPRCTVANYILLAFTILIAAAVFAKFIAALQLGTKRMPELRDKFVICQVPCYTEGEESLRKTIDSLATLKYDDKRKLIFVICDGMIIGSGNDQPTPRIVLDLLGVDPAIDPDPLLFQSVSEGSKQLNYGKVYSGLYEVDGHVVPYVVVVKVGKPSERSKPGNRGKRDSQILLMRFLNRIHFDAPMCPLELEICHQIKNVIGVEPQLYEFLFTIDADTEVYPDALNRLVSAASDDGRIIGICGETKLSNEKVSWWTMIQVYEYYISHHLSKAFESLFGSVTCLPGCFTLYRIRSADKGRPLVVSNLIIDEYAEIHVDTLHKKNLFSLGEDRFFTTLLMKHFPHYKTKFIPDATAMTAAPETWAVLLSQRRRWINSTIHNLGELMFLEDMCGFCCFSMRFFVMLDLVGTVILPSTTVYIIYLIVIVSTKQAAIPIVSLVIIAAVYGLQVVIFLLKREWGLIFWLLIYLLAYPIWSFFLPIYSFWHFDDFSWGNTRMVVGEGKNKKVLADTDDVGFDPSVIPLRKFSDYQAAMWDEDGKSSRAGGGYGRRPESVGGFSMASRPMGAMGMMGAGGSVMGGGGMEGGGDYYRDGHPRSTMYRSSGMNLAAPGSYNRSDSRSPSQRGSMMAGPNRLAPLNDFGGFQPGLNQHQSMISLAGIRAAQQQQAAAMSVFNGAGPHGPGSVRGSMMDFANSGAATPGMFMSPGYPSMMPMGGSGTGDMQHAHNMSMFGMPGAAGGIMPGNPSMMMGGTPSMMMMNPMGGGPGGGAMMGYNPLGNPGAVAGAPQQQVASQPLVQNFSADPSDDQVVETLRIYLSQQDLMKITKRSVRDALNHWFPNANLNEKKAFINAQIDKILAGNN